MTRRRWGLVLLSVAFLAYALGQEWLSIRYEIIENHLLDVFVGISAAVAGIVALDRRPGNPIGWLLVGIAVAWHADPYVLLDLPGVTVIATLIGGLHVALIGHLVLAYPTGRVQTRLERVLVIVFYSTNLSLALVEMAVFDPRAWGCAQCIWRPAIWPSEHAHELIMTVGGYLTTAEVLLFFVAVGLRFGRSSQVERHNLMPLWVGALLLGLIEILGTTGDPYAGGFLFLVWQIRSVLLILVPLVFLYGLLTDRTAKTAIGDLVLRLEGDIPTGQLGPILADALGDPALRIVYAATTGDGWVTAEGQPAGDPADQEDRHHQVTVIERDHRPYAALIHDRALSPTLVSGVASAAALAIENEWLHAELKAQLEEVRASRIRIVAAGDAERRRVERNLHDGAQRGCSPSPWRCASPAASWRTAPNRSSTMRWTGPRPSFGWPSTSSASWLAASIPPSSPTTGWRRRCGHLRPGRRCRSASCSTCRAGCRRRSRPRRTSRSARRWPT